MKELILSEASFQHFDALKGVLLFIGAAILLALALTASAVFLVHHALLYLFKKVERREIGKILLVYEAIMWGVRKFIKR